MRKKISFFVGIAVIIITTVLACLVPLTLHHGMDMIGKVTFISILALGYFAGGLVLWSQS